MAEGIGEAIQIPASTEVREPLRLVSTAVRKIKQAAIADRSFPLKCFAQALTPLALSAS
jgi:hypothetical protein